MKKLLILGSVFCVAACSGVDHEPFKGQSHMAVKTEAAYVNKSTSQVKSELGEPSTIRSENPNKLWIYRDRHCTKLLYFDGSDTCSYAEARGMCTPPKSVEVASK